VTTSGGAGSILITGAASGIGAAVAALAAARGYALVLVDRDEAGLADLTYELPPTNVQARAGDVTDEALLRSIVAGTRPWRPALTGAVACAGIEVLGDVQTLTADEWTRCLAVNLTGTFNTARAVLSELIETKGALAFLASDAGHVGAQGYAAYCASKHGVIGLMRAMALDLGPVGVRVNALAPGFVDTPMAARIFGEDPSSREYYEGTVPLGRFAQPSEIAKAALHLISDEASYTSGSIYHIDGASTAGYFERPSS